jgi:flagellar secretion chaperone FliS
MNPKAAQNYLRTKVLTATPEQLQLMLFDGAIRFCQQARVALEQKNYEQSFSLIGRAQEIINQLRSGLRPDVDANLCAKLSSIYSYIYRRLIEASIKHKIPAIDEAINLLTYQRETWVKLMETLCLERAADSAKNINIPGPEARMEAGMAASISMQG